MSFVPLVAVNVMILVTRDVMNFCPEDGGSKFLKMFLSLAV
jgi:hypothetical protein